MTRLALLTAAAAHLSMHNAIADSIDVLAIPPDEYYLNEVVRSMEKPYQSPFKKKKNKKWPGTKIRDKNQRHRRV